MMSPEEQAHREAGCPACVTDLEQALALVCAMADDWAGEYGFTRPELAQRVVEATATIRRELHVREIPS